MMGERLDVLHNVRPAVTDGVIHLTSTATPKQTGGEHTETRQLELSSELKYTDYSLFI